MAYTNITALPTAPSRARPSTFAAEGDAFLAALATFVTEVNASGSYIDGVGAAADTDAATATAQAAAAATSATNAATSATNAATSATNASTSETNAASSAAAAAASFDSFDDRYLGAKASDPATDNDGDSLSGGMIYYNTGDGNLKLYNGSAWVAAVLDPSGALMAANNLSDLASAATAITNLGITATAAELNYVDGVTSNIQTQIDNIGGTVGTLTKSFLSGETATITLSSSVSPTAVVAVTKEVGQTGVSSKGAWDVNTTASNYELYNQAPSTSLTLQGWDISTASFVQSFSVSSQEGSPHGVHFKADGTKMYIIGTDGDDVNEYDLSTAWDISTASYSQNFSIASQDTFPSDLFFKPDGTKMYIVGDSGADINEYDLSTAWDISTATYSQNFAVADTAPQAVFFKPDGTKMYVTGQTLDRVYEYDLSTAWDISTASENQFISVATEETNPRGLSFKSDGTKMYITGNNGQDVNEYNLSTAWDISTASAYQVFSVSSQATYPTGIYLRDDGFKMYIVGLTSDEVHEYDVSGPFLLGTGSFSASDVGKRIFVDDGGEAVITATDGSYSLSSAFGASTYTSGNWSLSGLDVDATNGITLSGVIINTWDISTASYDSVSFDVSSQDTNPRDIFFKPDGTKMYVVGGTGDDINEYNLSTAWDVSTASYNQNFSIAIGGQLGIFFREDGLKMYVLGSTNDEVREYDLSTAWDISTSTHLQNFSISGQETGGNSVHFKSDGTKMFVMGTTGDDVNEYHLSTAWDISTASYDSAFSVSAQDTIPTAIFFKTDGSKMYHGGLSGDDVYEYNLSTAWDVSTAVYSQSFSAPDAADSYGMFIKPDGSKMYLSSSDGDAVYQYSIGNNKQPTAQYLPALTSTTGQIDSTYWTDINSMTADDADNDGQVYYAVSTDDRTTWSIAKASDGVREIVRDNSGTWQYNSNATYGSTTWANATTNDEFAAIEQAMSVAANQMDKTQLDAVADGSHFTLGNTLDLAIILYLASSGTASTSDGVTINYDAAALNKGAILGTDYDYDVPAIDKVRITSNAAQNLKIRIV